MKVKVEHDGEFLPSSILESAIDIIDKCLQGITTIDDKFIVNDTLYFRKQRTGKVTTCVMNSASYMSTKFQSNLAAMPGCQGETQIAGQNIDGLIVKKVDAIGYRIKDRNLLLKVLHDYIEKENLPERSVYTLFPMFYGMYTGRGLYDIHRLPSNLFDLFEEVQGEKEFRLGVEFETGNVASSFRAFNKLFVLFQNGHIDAGIFVTCTDKANSATRIWPVSNRNGSFHELKQRRFLEQVSLPLLCIGFSPDNFDSSAPFLGKNGSLYSPKAKGVKDQSGLYELFTGEDGEEILRPRGI